MPGHDPAKGVVGNASWERDDSVVLLYQLGITCLIDSGASFRVPLGRMVALSQGWGRLWGSWLEQGSP